MEAEGGIKKREDGSLSELGLVLSWSIVLLRYNLESDLLHKRGSNRMWVRSAYIIVRPKRHPPPLQESHLLSPRTRREALSPLPWAELLGDSGHRNSREHNGQTYSCEMGVEPLPTSEGKVNKLAKLTHSCLLF